MATTSITHETWLAYPPERVWQGLTDATLLSKWLMPNDIVPELGQTFTFRTNPMPGLGFDGICSCTVTACEPPRLLAYTWAGGALSTVVTFRLEPEGAGTRLVFEHSGFDLENSQQAGSYRGMQSGWAANLDTRLPRALAS